MERLRIILAGERDDVRLAEGEGAAVEGEAGDVVLEVAGHALGVIIHAGKYPRVSAPVTSRGFNHEKVTSITKRSQKKLGLPAGTGFPLQ